MKNARAAKYLSFLGALIVLCASFSAQAQTYGYYSAQATNVSNSYALLTASVNPNGYQTNVWFEYGTSSALGYAVGQKSIGDGTTPVTVAYPLNNLSPNTTYYFRIAVQSNCYNNNYPYVYNNYNNYNNGYYNNGYYYNNYNNYNNYPYQNNYNSYCNNSYSGGTQYGPTQTFTTTNTGYNSGSVSVPGVDTTVATQTGSRSSAMHGTVRPNNSDTTVWFEYGTTNSFGLTSPTKLISAINTSVTINFYASGLQAGTTYYYRMVGQNSAGKTNGATLALTTLAAPAPAPVPVPQPNPTPASTPAPEPQNSTSSNSIDLNQPSLSMSVKIDSASPAVGDEVKYTATIINQGASAVDKANLSVNFPKEIKFIDGGQSPSVDGNTVKISLSNIEKGGKRIVPLRFKVQDSAVGGSSLPIGSFLSYTVKNKPMAANADATLLVKSADNSSSNTAILSENLPAFAWLKWVLWVLVVLLIVLLIYIAYRFLKSWLSMH